MVTTLRDAVAAAEAGADVVVAQGTEGGGHVGEIGTTVIVRQAVKALTPVPVLAAGGYADGAGLASALALGADGVLLGTRFLASAECAAEGMYKDAVVACESEGTMLTTVLDSLSGRDWPGAWSRAARTKFVEEWLGREPELRRQRAAVRARLEAAVEAGDVEYQALWLGQSAGLVDSVEPAGELVRAIVAEAEADPPRAASRAPAITSALRYNGRRDAGWSSQVARRAHNPEVAGSNPAPATRKGPAYGPFLVLVFLPVCYPAPNTTHGTTKQAPTRDDRPLRHRV